MFTADKYRDDFPILSREVYGKPLVYFDNTASTQTPRQVVDTVTDMYFHHKANVHRGVHALSQEATSLMEESRRKVKDFIGATSEKEVIFHARHDRIDQSRRFKLRSAAQRGRRGHSLCHGTPFKHCSLATAARLPRHRDKGRADSGGRLSRHGGIPEPSFVQN